MKVKKYILVITVHQEKETLFCRMIDMLKEEFRIIYATDIAETLGLLKMIKPALTLINRITLQADVETMNFLKQLIVARYKIPVLLYAVQPNKVSYLQQEGHQPTVCTTENISVTVHELKTFIHYRNSFKKNKRDT